MHGVAPANLARFTGFAGRYDRYRPSPPAVLVDILSQLARTPRPGLVVDIGCGTGLSTRIWSGRADKVIGIEPNPDMRGEARRVASALGLQDVFHHDGTSTETGLADGCADVVTCVQSLHWMEPEPTFAEVARILRQGGVFAACDSDWPPTMLWEAEAAYLVFHAAVQSVEERHGVSRGLARWNKDGHLDRIRASGRFGYVREILVHQVESGTAERLVGLAMSQGGVAGLLKQGLTEDELGLATFRQEAHRILGEAPLPWYFSYRVRVGVKS